jgi:signal transduction histidine kinase
MFLVLIPVLANAQGLPAIRNYTAEEYGAHNRNFDIEIGEEGTVYVANFEGLLYYDRAQWRIIHTPSINRLTVVYRAENDTIWVGGYNYFGRIQKKGNGDICLERIGKPDLFHGEVMEIYEDKGKVLFVVDDQRIYEVNGKDVRVVNTTDITFNSGLSPDILDVEAIKQGKDFAVMGDITQTLSLGGGLKVQVKNGHGLIITDESDKILYTITEDNGLCSNAVAYVEYDEHGLLWGATDHGVFSVELPSAYSLFLPKDGLTGEVHTIIEWRNQMFVGTNNGLFRMEGRRFVPYQGINTCCWKLLECEHGLLAATSNGVYLFSADGSSRQLTTDMSLELMTDGDDLYIGQQNSVVLYRQGQPPRKICDVEQVTKIYKDHDCSIWLQNVYGEIYVRQVGKDAFLSYQSDAAGRMAATLVPMGDRVEVISATATEPFPYPAFSTMDGMGVTWLTDNVGKQLCQWKYGKRFTGWETLLYPYHDMTVSALYYRQHKIWIGGDNMLAVIDTDKHHLTKLTAEPHLLIRSVTLGSDSVLWGGYGQQPEQLPSLASDERTLRFSYALDYAPLTGSTLYRYKLNDENWSAWSNEHEAEFLNLPYGSYTLTVQACMADGRLSEETTIAFSISYPFFMRWYMVCLYGVLLCLLIWAYFRQRIRMLREDKIKLERIVQERTSEVVKQKDEIEEKSNRLEKALADLGNAQNELIRQEKMATVGKLTQGLIDRILNPLNYINNFSKLSEGLLKDIEANIEDDKDNISQENYEDTVDVLRMLHGNLQKVSEHGQNTTRTLKAMEEMLKDRTGGYVDTDLKPILTQDEAMLNNYYAKERDQYHIRMTFSVPDERLPLHGNPELLSKTIMSILGNAVYAVVKKAQRQAYDAEVSLRLTQTDGTYILKIRDNGIGIEETIIDKIFDPFFTTKTTGEAAGTGLYLSHEVIQNHGGDITVESVKNEYSEFTVTLPVLTPIPNT